MSTLEPIHPTQQTMLLSSFPLVHLCTRSCVLRAGPGPVCCSCEKYQRVTAIKSFHKHSAEWPSLVATPTATCTSCFRRRIKRVSLQPAREWYSSTLATGVGNYPCDLSFARSPACRTRSGAGRRRLQLTPETTRVTSPSRARMSREERRWSWALATDVGNYPCDFSPSQRGTWTAALSRTIYLSWPKSTRRCTASRFATLTAR